MFCTLSYPSTRSFNKTYSAVIAALFFAALIGISVWTLVTKKDCVPYTSLTYQQDICHPYNLYNGAEVRQSSDGITPFVYNDRIIGLAEDYKYENTVYSCTNVTAYRIVLSADRSTQINYIVSCFFHDEARVPFSLIASTVSNNVDFGWDGDFSHVNCPFKATSYLQSLVFANSDGTGPGTPMGINIDDRKCSLWVWIDADRNITVYPPSTPKSYVNQHRELRSIREYALYKSEKAKTFAVNSNMKFMTAYICYKCSRKSGWDLLLTLLTSIGSVGGMVYSVLIYLGQTLYTRTPDAEKYGDLDLEKIGALSKDKDTDCSSKH
ncbi:hypothetical protein EC968_000635 [Mortierella alpina]|nr:hypothetical protein EC968_000635 [Mortierella alpina]